MSCSCYHFAFLVLKHIHGSTAQKRAEPSLYNSLVTGALAAGQLQTAAEVLTLMRSGGVPVEPSALSVLSAQTEPGAAMSAPPSVPHALGP